MSSEEEKTNTDGTYKNLHVSLQGIMHKNKTKDDISNKFEISGKDFSKCFGDDFALIQKLLQLSLVLLIFTSILMTQRKNKIFS